MSFFRGLNFFCITFLLLSCIEVTKWKNVAHGADLRWQVNYCTVKFVWIFWRRVTQLSYRLGLNNGRGVVNISDSCRARWTHEVSGKPVWAWRWAAHHSSIKESVDSHFDTFGWVICISNVQTFLFLYKKFKGKKQITNSMAQ